MADMRHFDIVDSGSVVLLTPISDEARTWVEDNVEVEDWQWYGDAFACEPRMAEAILDGFSELYQE